MLGLLAIFCCFSLVTTALEKAAAPLPHNVDFFLFFLVEAFFLAVCLLTAISCFYFLLPKNWENYEKSYEYYDLEGKPPLNIKIEKSDQELKNISDELITEDKLADIPCEVFWNGRWLEGKIIRQLKLLTGIGKQFCRIYLVEMGTPPVRQWVSADLIRQPSEDRLEPEEYH
jgi:hypothetical protein